MAKKANAAAEGLCKFAFWTAIRCEFHKSLVTRDRGWSHGDVPWSFQDCEAKDGLFEGAKISKVGQRFEFRAYQAFKNTGRYRKQSSTKLALS